MERVKFYADTPRNEKNKYFCFECNILTLEECLIRFILKGFNIRAAWYEKINTSTGEIENKRITDIQRITDKAYDLPKTEKDRIVGVEFTKQIQPKQEKNLN